MRVWINFKELRSRLKAEDVLRLYKVEVKRKGDQHKGSCPLPSHVSRGTKEASFSVNLEQGIFQCFGCGAKGNILEFAALMEGVDLKDGSALREVAVKLQQEFFPEGASSRKKGPSRAVTKPQATNVQTTEQEKEANSLPPPQSAANIVVNGPLDFDLKGLDPSHPFLTDRLSPETISHFALGYCSRGMLKDRIAVPLNDAEGRLIGYAGRAANDERITDSNPRYRFPPKREREGVVHDFQPGLLLYNACRVSKPCDDLFVVEDFDSAWWLHENGHPSTVALMGSECSEEQADQLVKLLVPSGCLWIIPKGGKEGEWLAHFMLLKIASPLSVRPAAE